MCYTDYRLFVTVSCVLRCVLQQQPLWHLQSVLIVRMGKTHESYLWESQAK